MESLGTTTACFRDDLLDFPSDISDDDEDDVVFSSSSPKQRRRAFSFLPPPHHVSPAFSEFVEEEELEWISNKDAFPMVESFVDIIPNHPGISSNNNGGFGGGGGGGATSSSHLSPVSVLENSSTSSSGGGGGVSSTMQSYNFANFSSSNSRGGGSNGSGAAGALSAMISLTGIFKVPGKARSKQLRKRRRELSGEQFQCWEKMKPISRAATRPPGSCIGRKCLHCGAEKTPQWRAGPYGPKTLCNACGVRYKSGRLVPEYRPASSPTFSNELHSNSHRKIVEMRKQKMVHGELVATPPEHVG